MKRRKLTAMILAAGLAFSLAVPALAASAITSTNELDHAVLPGLSDSVAPSGIFPTADGGFMVTDTYARVIWKVKDGQCTLYAGGGSATDPYGQPVGGYHDTALGQSLFREPWAIIPFLDGWAVSDPDNDAVRMVRMEGTETVNPQTEEPLETLEKAASKEEIASLRLACRRIHVHQDLRDYLAALTQRTRRRGAGTAEGVSPRGTLALLRASQGLALVRGREFVVPEDIKDAAVPTLSHRYICEASGDYEKEKKISALLSQVSVPTEDWSRA